MQGPNVKKLIVFKMSTDAIPSGSTNPFVDGVRFLADPQRIGTAARDATRWVEEAIAVVKSSPDNPYGDDNEAIAGEILRQIEQRKRASNGPTQETPIEPPPSQSRQRKTP